MSAVELAQRAVERVGDRAEAAATVEVGTSALTRFANSFIHQNVAEEGTVVSLTVAVGARVATATTTQIDDDALARLADAAVAAARVQEVDPRWPGLAPPAPVTGGGHHDPATAVALPSLRAEIVGAFVAAGEGLEAAGYCETVGRETAFVNSRDQVVAASASHAMLDGIHQVQDSAGSAHAASVAVGHLDGGVVGARAADIARRSVGAADLEPGEYEVVLGPECTATLAVFLGFYGFNAKAHQENQSFVALGARQFDAAFELVDDPDDPRALGVPFDAEGTPKRRLELVTGGVSRALAHDRRTAAAADTTSTGHAVPGSAVYGPVPYSLFVGAGNQPVAGLVGAVERGLLVTTFNYSRVLEPKSLVVTGLSRNGTFLIEGGEITRPVTNLRFTQSFVDALAPGRVLGVGDDDRLADSEFGPGMVHAPSLRLAGWRFTGGASG
jgi:predicted Zn-dependent protease